MGQNCCCESCQEEAMPKQQQQKVILEEEKYDQKKEVFVQENDNPSALQIKEFDVINDISRNQVNLDPLKQSQIENENQDIIQQQQSDSKVIDNQQSQFKILNKYIIKNGILFGTDDDQFIMEFKPDSIIYTPKDQLHESIQLYNQQGGVIINKNQYFLFGGITFKKDKTFQQTAQSLSFIYDTSTKQGIPQQNLITAVYGSLSTCIDFNYVYVIGGRELKQRSTNVTTICQRYNIKQNQWDKIGDLKIARENAQLTVSNNKIYVWGGYMVDKKLPREVEFYDDQSNQWNFLDWEIPFPLFSASIYQNKNKDGKDEIIIVGGKINQYENKSIFSMEMKVQLDSQQIYFNQIYFEIHAISSDIDRPRLMPKIFEYDQDVLVIFGGNKTDFKNPFTFYNKTSKKMEKVNDEQEIKFIDEFKDSFKLKDPSYSQYLYIK